VRSADSAAGVLVMMLVAGVLVMMLMASA